MRASLPRSASLTPAQVRVSHLAEAAGAAPELAALLLLGAIIRLALLNAQSGWSDEATTMAVVQAGWRGLVHMQAHDLHPVLYFLLLRAWLLVTGFGLLRARLFSTLCDLATLVVLYSLARRLFDRPTALVASLLFALSPIAVWYAATARMYALTELLALLTIRLLVEARLTSRMRYCVGFGACGALAINADYSGGYLVCAGVSWYLLLAVRRKASLQPLLGSLGIMGILLIPTAVLLHRQITGPGLGLSQAGWIPAPTPSRVWATLGDLVSQQVPNGLAVALVGSALALAAVVLCGREARLPGRSSSYLLIACMMLAPLVLSLLVSQYRSVFITRQVMTAMLDLLLLFGRAIVLLWNRHGPWRPLAGMALAALLLLNIASLRVMADSQLTEDWQHAVPYVLSHSRGKTLLVFNPYFFNGPFFLYTGSNTSNLQIDWPPLAPPGPHVSTVWLIDVYPPPRPSLPPAWSARHLRLTAERRFTNITIFRVVENGA